MKSCLGNHQEKPGQFFLILLLISLIPFSGCKKDNPVDSRTSGLTTFSGSVEVYYHSLYGGPILLSHATLQLDSLTFSTDSAGSFSIRSIAFGRHALTIFYPGIVPIDTAVSVTDSTKEIDFVFVLYHFAGTVSFADPANPYATNLLQTRIILDGKHTEETTSMAPNFDFGYLIAGKHSVHIDSTSNTSSVDTMFSAGGDYDYGTANPYAFFAKPVLREFIFPTAIGTSWRYRYYATDRWYNQSKTTQTGIHVWSVSNSAPAISGQVLTVLDVSTDTVSTTFFYGQRPDTTYVTSDTTSFAITINASGISINCPELSQSIPRFVILNNDTLSIGSGYAQVGGTYLNHVGMLNSGVYYPGTTPSSISLGLLEFTKP